LSGAVVYKQLDGRAGVGYLDDFDLKIAANCHEIVLGKFGSVAAKSLADGCLAHGGFAQK
jgi:hypothetical protein